MNLNPKFYQALVSDVRERNSKSKAREAEALRLVRKLVIAAGVSLPPTDLHKLARYLDVDEIKFTLLAMKGRLLLKRNRVSIEVNECLSDFERRFTTAHELAHLILENKRLNQCIIDGENLRADNLLPYHVIENLCDLAAEEILLPSDWFEERIGVSSPSLDIASVIAQEVKCEVDFVLKRAIGLDLWRCRIMWIERKKNTYVAHKTFPEMDEGFLTFMQLCSVIHSSPVIGKPERGEVKIKVSDEVYKFKSEFLPLSKNMFLALLKYRN